MTWVDMRLESFRMMGYPDYSFSEYSSSNFLPARVLALLREVES